MQQQPGFAQWRQRNQNRHNLLYWQQQQIIPGIAHQMENRRTDLRVHADRYNNRMEAAEVTIEVSARSPEEGPVKAAQRAENFYYALYHDFRRMRAGRMFGAERRALDQMTCFGCGIFHLDFAPDLRQRIYKKEIRDVADLVAALGSERIQGNPFVLEVPSIQATFWEPDLSRFCEVGEKAIAQIVEDLGSAGLGDIVSETMPEGESSWDKKAKVYHLETREFVYDVVELGEPRLVEFRPNLAGRPTYVLMPGNLTSENTPDEMFQPLIGPIYPVVEELAVLGTLLNSGALSTGRPTYQLVEDGKRGAMGIADWMMMPQQERPVLRVDLIEEQIQRPPAGFHYEVMPVPSQEWLQSAYQEKRREVYEYGFPPPISPDSAIKASSGYERTKIEEPALTLLEPPLRNRAAAWHELCNLAGEIIKELDIPVTILAHRKAEGRDIREAINISPEDFREVELQVSFTSTTAAAEFASREDARTDLQLGLMSKQDYMRLRYDDPVSATERIDFERMEEAVKQMAFQDAMLIIQAQRGELMEQAAAEANLPFAMPPEGMPPEGGPTEPGGVREQRPPGGAFPGVGGPVVPPDQLPPGEGMAQAVGVAP